MAKAVALRELPEVRILENITRETAERVIEDLAAYRGKPVALSIFSNGGDALASNAIAKYIANPANGLDVEARIYGAAFSGAMIISASCQSAYVADGSSAMIHMAYRVEEDGTRVPDDQLSKEDKDTLAAINADQINLFTKRSGLSREEVVKLMEEQREIPARKAADMGFFNGIIPQALRFAAFKNINMSEAPKTRQIKVSAGAALTAIATGVIEIPESELTISDADKVKELETQKAQIEAQLADLKAKADTVPSLEAAKVAAEADRDRFKAEVEKLKTTPLAEAITPNGGAAQVPGSKPQEKKTPIVTGTGMKVDWNKHLGELAAKLDGQDKKTA